MFARAKGMHVHSLTLQPPPTALYLRAATHPFATHQHNTQKHLFFFEMQTENFPTRRAYKRANVTNSSIRRRSKQGARIVRGSLGTHFNIVSLSLNGQFFCNGRGVCPLKFMGNTTRTTQLVFSSGRAFHFSVCVCEPAKVWDHPGNSPENISAPICNDLDRHRSVRVA